MAAIDESGYIRLAGRLKDMIKRGGENIFASEVEALISDHPRVAAVSVIGVTDPEMGERVCAWIQPKSGFELTSHAITQWLQDKGASVLQCPEIIKFIKHMPLTPTGKINKRSLKELTDSKRDDTPSNG